MRHAGLSRGFTLIAPEEGNELRAGHRRVGREVRLVNAEGDALAYRPEYRGVIGIVLPFV